MILRKWISTCQRLKLDPLYLILTKINSKWTKDLSATPEIMKVVRGNMSRKQLRQWLYVTPKVQETKAKLGLYQTKKLVHSEGNH
jgi:hypothetical protein